jgi:hypothetical protein
MPDQRLSSLPAASALTGTELFYSDDGTKDAQVTANQLKTFCGGGSGGITVGTTTVTGGTSGRLLYDNAGLAGELATTGSGNVVLATSPTLTTAALGSSTATTQAQADNSTKVATTAYVDRAAPILRSYIAGLALSNDGTTPNSVLDIAAGMAADSGNSVYISIGAFTKSTAGAWTSGSGNNGMGNGLTVAASTWYHVILANNGGTPDIYFDTSATGANRPAGISDTKVRRIGSFLTDGSAHILSFVQDGDTFYWGTLPTDVAVTNLASTSGTLFTLSTPLGVKTRPLLRISASTTNGAVTIQSPDETDVALPASATTPTNADTSPGWYFAYNTNPAGDITGLHTNTSSQIRARATNATGGSQKLTIFTRGYVDDRERYA